jgi:hypothetical protein
MFIGAGACACCADATALDATITRAIVAGRRQRVQILADQHVISPSSLLLSEETNHSTAAILGEKIDATL